MLRMHGRLSLVMLLLIQCTACYSKAGAGKTLQGNLDPCALYASKVDIQCLTSSFSVYL